MSRQEESGGGGDPAAGVVVVGRGRPPPEAGRAGCGVKRLHHLIIELIRLCGALRF